MSTRLVLTCLGLVLLARAAHAQDARESCRVSYERGQELRLKGRLMAARRELAACAAGPCSAFVKRDCAKWGDEVAAEQPSIVVAARGSDGADLTVRLSIDGAVSSESTGGLPLEVDPGEHVFRFEAAGYVALEQRLVVQLAEKKRVVGVTLEQVASALVPRAEARPPPLQLVPAPAPARRPSGARVAAWALWGLAGAAAISFGALAAHGYASESSAAKSCAPFCARNTAAQIYVEYLVADVSLGVAAASALAAIALLVFGPAESDAALAGAAGGMSR